MMETLGNTPSLLEMIRGGAFLVDVRSAEEFSSGSVQGAINIPLSEIPNSLSKFQGKKGVIVFCRSGNRSGQAQAILKHSNIPNVANGGTWMEVSNLVQLATR